MQTQPIDRAEVQALLHRARLGMVARALGAAESYCHSFEVFKAYAKALNDVLVGAGKACAGKDALSGGYQAYGSLQAAVTRLPVDLESLSLIEVRDLLASQNITLGTEPVANGNVDAVQQLVNGVAPVIKPDDEQPVAGVDSHNAAVLHGPSVSQGVAA